MRVAADSMLGRLAKYLRLCGIDATYHPHINDLDLIRHVRTTDRILFTRDTLLLKRRQFITGELPAVFIVSDQVKDQLRQCLEFFAAQGWQIDPQNPSSRCPLCNAELKETARDSAFGQVPAHVFVNEDRFWRCPECLRFFWRGSHFQHFCQTIKESAPLKA